MLGGRDLLLLPALYGVRLDHASDRTCSAGLQNWRDRLVKLALTQDRRGILAAKILMVLSASIIFLLGVVHLVYTFWGPNLTPRDPALQISMSQIAPVVTKETTMWRCWMGFNASHSMGLILFGLVFGFLAWLMANSSFGHRSCSLSGWQ